MTRQQTNYRQLLSHSPWRKIRQGQKEEEEEEEEEKYEKKKIFQRLWNNNENELLGLWSRMPQLGHRAAEAAAAEMVGGRSEDDRLGTEVAVIEVDDDDKPEWEKAI